MKIYLFPLALLVASPLAAQDTGISARIGIGAQSAPEYFGAEDNEVGVTGSFQLERLQLGGFSVGGEDTNGIGFGGSFRYIGERSADDYSELTGLEDVDQSLELGGGVRFNQPNYNLFADLRYGIVGHEAVVGEVGADFIYRPSAQLTLSAGPRILWGSDDYAQTYYGVTGAEASASAFDTFDAGGGILRQGVQAEAIYQFNDDWGVQGKIRYDNLRDDAADSPITQSDDLLTGSVVLTRKVTFGF